MGEWRPSATPETLQARAQLYASLRAFFAERQVMEVSTPALSVAATVDPNLHSWKGDSSTGKARWLQTSPEFPMKRLLAAGSGPIYQVCTVFRDGEQGRLHNPEFTMLEWYRPGFDHHALMDEVEALLDAVMPGARPIKAERLSYRDAVRRECGIDPLVSTVHVLRQCLSDHGVPGPDALNEEQAKDADILRDLLMGSVVGPKLGQKQPCFIYDYPASQAALARIRQGDPPVAERFELYWRGVELANGFNELVDATEQRQRFEADQAKRRRLELDVPPMDENLLLALESGLPECAGVALGLDRLLMLMLGLDSVSETLAFPFDRA